MAIIRKPILPLKGRYGPVVFYRLPAGLICRYLKPHTRKRILKDPKFAEFRKCSKRMAKASKIASAVYKALPENFRQFWMYRAFVGEALKMLKEKGMTGEKVLESLFKTYAEVWYIKAQTKKAKQRAGLTKRSNTLESNIRWKKNNAGDWLDTGFSIAHTNTFNIPAGTALLQSLGTGPPCIYSNNST